MCTVTCEKLWFRRMLSGFQGSVELEAGGEGPLSPSCQECDKKPLLSEQPSPFLSHILPHQPPTPQPLPMKMIQLPSSSKVQLRAGCFPREFHWGRRLSPWVIGLLSTLPSSSDTHLPWLSQSLGCLSVPPGEGK